MRDLGGGCPFLTKKNECNNAVDVDDHKVCQWIDDDNTCYVSVDGDHIKCSHIDEPGACQNAISDKEDLNVCMVYHKACAPNSSQQNQASQPSASVQPVGQIDDFADAFVDTSDVSDVQVCIDVMHNTSCNSASSQGTCFAERVL